MANSDHVLKFEDIMASLLSQTPNEPDAPAPAPVEVPAAGVPDPTAPAAEQVWEERLAEPVFMDEVQPQTVSKQAVTMSIAEMKARLEALKGGA